MKAVPAAISLDSIAASLAASANEKTAKNWLAGTRCPSGPHLISLARESEAVTAALLVLAKRELNVSALSLISLKAGLMNAVNAIDEAIDSSG